MLTNFTVKKLPQHVKFSILITRWLNHNPPPRCGRGRRSSGRGRCGRRRRNVSGLAQHETGSVVVLIRLHFSHH